MENRSLESYFFFNIKNKIERIVKKIVEKKQIQSPDEYNEEAAADWAALDDDLLRRIYTTLRSDLGDFVRFRAVCRGWRSFDSLLDHLPNTPWLLQCRFPANIEDISPDRILGLYSLASGYTGRIPGFEQYLYDVGIQYYGPGNGYLLVLRRDEKDLYLLNPLTGNTIQLPRLDLDTFNIHSLVFTGTDPRHECWYILSSIKRTTDHDGRNPEWDVEWTCIICRPVENSWTYLELGLHSEFCHTCCSGETLFVTDDGRTVAYNMNSGEILYQVGPPADENPNTVVSIHLVESAGDVLRVCLYYFKINTAGVSIRTKNIKYSLFKIYKLRTEEEGGRKKHSWVKVTDIGDRILFLDAMSGFSLKAPPGLDGNCIYYVTHTGSRPHRYDIGTGEVEEVPCPFDHSTWFIPRLD